ncbi:Lrp/AsnC family transcriptional regulator [Pseudomonas sp. JM0905a]|uniref:Lrp/AsnC family transcriptional regulator n=1 Tax=unclassified Pseudomonas TaxID=196821 RepID=UPI001688EB33|nr:MULTISPECIES: Lrp/AsnC family transcriptional regulator [unclassified Pseudomonas]MBD2837469.1 Lrp/AsnC family transcriptional regulator [Pseudomonas sp. JM0905a]MDH4559900.1 Lrp/AsnC family transcriptional regulator [Pseudomonas sp. BN411]MDH4869962.1 Lrp/AsnC family transcriptional regulator [Pseudomonas sp. BN515]
MNLDTTDLRILLCLQQNGRISNQELAEKVALSPSACLRRLRNLEDEGIIRGYRPVLDAERLGVELEALVHVSMRQDEEGWHERFVQKVQGWPEVIAAYIVTGHSNYVLRVQVRNLKQFSDFIVNRLNRANGVTDIRSEIILQTIKDGGGVLDLLVARK